MDMKSFNLVKHDPDLVDKIIVMDSKKLALWAIQCIERVLPIFYNRYPQVEIPKIAIQTLRSWIHNEIKMWDARKYCYTILEYARELEKTDKVATLILRGTSHMLATCHVKTHSEGAAMYAVAALKEYYKNKEDMITILEQERAWQISQLDSLQ